MPYTLQSGSPVYPAQVSYQLISLTSNIVVVWPFSFESGPIIARINDVSPSAGGFSITLPDATLASVGQDIIFNNVSAYSFTILAHDGVTTLATITAGQILYFYLYDSSTSNGLWRIIPFGGGTNAITALTAQSTDSSITITGGTVTPPGGTVNFQLPTSLYNLNSVKATAFPVITGTSPLTWTTRTLTEGANIDITNPNGINGNPVIALDTSLTSLTAIAVGNLSLNGSLLSAINPNSGFTISSNGTGILVINGVTIDSNSNVGLHNLVVNGSFQNAFVPKAWCVFTDSGSSVVIQDKGNVASVTGAGTGTYTITFSAALNDNYYGVLVSTGTVITAGLPVVTRGFSVYSAQTTTTCQIAVVNASGQFISQAPSGVTVQILSSN